MKKISYLLIILLAVVIAFGLFFYHFKNLNEKKIKAHPVPAKTTAVAHLAKNDNLTKKARVLFVGDMMFDRWIRQVSEKKGSEFIFKEVRNLLQSEDLVVGNLEGPITNSPSISLGSEFGSKNNYIFTFPTETAYNLYKENIRLVNIGNNHILDFGKKGLNETKDYLSEAHLSFFGDTGENSQRYAIKEINGIKIAFINFNQFSKTGKQNALDDLSLVKKNHPDFIVVYTHWGTEYTEKPNEKNRELAYEFIESGADLIIGSHPHTIQTKEEYKDKRIYYSLGNFIFDQYFNTKTQSGLLVEAEFQLNKKIDFKEHFVNLKNNGQTLLTE